MRKPTIEWQHTSAEITDSYNLEFYLFNFFEQNGRPERELKGYELKRIHKLIRDSYTHDRALEDVIKEAVEIILL